VEKDLSYIDKLKNKIKMMGRRELLNVLAEVFFLLKTVLFLIIYIASTANMQ